MTKFKNFLMAFVAIMGIALLGYHWTDGFYAFEQPTFLNIPFALAILFWGLMFMFVLKEWVQKNIRDKWKAKNIKLFKAVCVAVIAFFVGCTIANIGILGTILTSKEIVSILMIPLMATVLYGLKEDKNTGWIGGDPSKSKKTPKTGTAPVAGGAVPKGGDIDQ